MKKKSELSRFLDMANIEYDKKENRDDLYKKVDSYLKKYKYAPRYLRGLEDEEKWNKKFEIRYYHLLDKQNKPFYKEVETDKQYKSRNKTKKYSKYTMAYNKLYPNDPKTLSQKSKRTGVPLDILQKVNQKGKSAWRGGQHRPGASQEQWGISRVNSFLLCGKTFYFPDHLLAKEAMKRSRKAKERWEKMGCDFKKMGKRTKSR